MKKSCFCVFLLLLAAIMIVGCSKDSGLGGNGDGTLSPDTGQSTPGTSQPPDGGAQAPPDPPLYHAIMEYGDPEVIKNNNGPLYAYIRFPQAGDATDAVIAEWAYGIYDSAETELAGMLVNDPTATGEVNVHFDSWLLDGKYAGILQFGSYSHLHAAHPTDIVQTYNIDLSRGVFLENKDILDMAQQEEILGLLRVMLIAQHPHTENLIADMDERWLSLIVVGSDGLKVVLARYEFFPGYFGTLTVTLPYSGLGSAFLLGADQPPLNPIPMAPPSTDPTAPTPTPTPPDPTAPTSTPTPPDPTAPTPTPPPTDPTAPTPTPTPNPIPIVPPQSGDIDPTRPMLALSFDDGPSAKTSLILDLLEQYGARATFFTIGNLVNSHGATVKRAVSIGCEVAGHSWDHKNLSKLSESEIKGQLLDTRSVIEENTGLALPFFRPPYGAVSDTLRSVSRELGFALINWNVDPMDWDTRDADLIFNAIMHDARNGSLILSHDIYGATAEAMSRVIPALIAEGYQLVTVTELLNHKHGALEAGKVYYN